MAHPLRLRAVLVATALLGPVAAASAGLFDFFTSAACPARDWRCLLGAAEKETFERPVSEVPDFSKALLLERVADAYPAPDRLAVMERFYAAAPEGDMKTELEQARLKARLAARPDPEALDKALLEEASPVPGIGWPDYVKIGFEALLAHGDEAKALELRDRHQDVIWDRANLAEGAILGWLAKFDVDEMARRLEHAPLPNRGWMDMSAEASSACLSGDKARGGKILAMLKGQQARSSEDQVRLAMDLAYAVPATADCEGLQAGEDRLRETLQQMTRDIAAAGAKYRDEGERKFITGTIRSTVSTAGVRWLVHRFLDAGRPDDALRVFNMLPPSDVSLEVTIEPGKTAGRFGFSSAEWEEERQFWESFLIDDPKPARFPAAIAAWEKLDGYGRRTYEIARLDNYVDAVPRFDGPKKPLVERLKAILDAVSDDPETLDRRRELNEIALARIEFALAGCAPADDQLLAWQKGSQKATYLETRLKARIALAKLLQAMGGAAAGPRDATYGDCLVAKKAS